MVEQKERTRIAQSGKNCAMNCAIQGVRLTWKHAKDLIGHLWVSFATFLSINLISSFCTLLQVFSFNFNFLHCLGLILIDMLSANKHGEIFACILLIQKKKLLVGKRIAHSKIAAFHAIAVTLFSLCYNHQSLEILPFLNSNKYEVIFSLEHDFESAFSFSFSSNYTQSLLIICIAFLSYFRRLYQ